MSSWPESIWIVRKIKSLLDNQTSSISTPIESSINSLGTSINSLGTSITGTTSSVALSDAIDILASLDNTVFLQIDPAEETEES